jgi:galactokinase
VSCTTLEMPELSARLTAGGMPAAQAAAKAKLFASVVDRLTSRGVNPHAGARAFYVPGRIEFLGKHTDYAGGRSLICAVDRGFCIVAVPRSDSVVRVIGETSATDVTFNLDPELMPVVGHWSNYPMTVGRRVSRNFPGPLLGADIAFASDLPQSSGLSSSSALIIAFFLCVSAVNRLDERGEYTQNIKNKADLAGYLGTIENGQTFGTLEGDRGVGTFGGSEDHTAILTALPGQLSQYSFCPVVHERQVPLPADHSLVIGVSGVIAEKTGAALHSYNNASLSARAVLDHWRKTSGRNDATLAAAVAGSGDAVLRSLTQPELVDRLNQFVAESTQIIPAAGDALLAGRLTELGTLVDRSQELADRLLRNQVAETVYLSKSARECGAVAASSFGAGFGGSVWALVRNSEVDSFIANWRSKYQAAFPEPAQRAAFFAAFAGVPALAL